MSQQGDGTNIFKRLGNDLCRKRMEAAGMVSEEAIDAFMHVYFGTASIMLGDRQEVHEALIAAFKAKGRRYVPFSTEGRP